MDLGHGSTAKAFTPSSRTPSPTGGELFPTTVSIVGGDLFHGPGFAPGRRGPTGDRVGIASDAQERTPIGMTGQQQLQQQSSTDVDVALTDRFKDQHDEW